VSDHESERRHNLDAAEDVIERLEWADGAQEDTPHKRWRDVSRRTALTGGAAGLATLILQACGGGKKESSTGTTAAKAQTSGTPAAGVFGSQKKFKFIATPGALNIQPRIDGALDSIKKSGKPVKPHTIATGAALPKELTTINGYWQGHPNTKGMFAVDAGSTQGVAQTIQRNNLRDKGVKGGGYDLLPTIQKLLAAGEIDFTIDQQPYLQGFLPILQLYMYQASGSLTGVADVNTGLKFLDKTTIVPYNDTTSRYEGNSSAAGVKKG
jgi:simple sugar transport system substrate-binding protein